MYQLEDEEPGEIIPLSSKEKKYFEKLGIDASNRHKIRLNPSRLKESTRLLYQSMAEDYLRKMGRQDNLPHDWDGRIIR